MKKIIVCLAIVLVFGFSTVALACGVANGYLVAAKTGGFLGQDYGSSEYKAATCGTQKGYNNYLWTQAKTKFYTGNSSATSTKTWGASQKTNSETSGKSFGNVAANKGISVTGQFKGNCNRCGKSQKLWTSVPKYF